MHKLKATYSFELTHTAKVLKAYTLQIFNSVEAILTQS